MRLFTTAHVLLFLYVVSAIIFWGISLENKSQTIYELEYENLNNRIDSIADREAYDISLLEIQNKRSSRTKQYIGEGSTFLLVIIIGAAVVYTSFRRSISLSRQQNNFMLSVTHELKSPIAAMKLNLQTMAKHKLDEEKRSLLINRCVNESNRLNDLCNNMLLASQIEGRQYKPAKEKFSYSDLVRDSIKDYAQSYPDRFIADDLGDFQLLGDKTLVQMAVNNLLENAVKYTPADKKVTVTMTERNGNAVLAVADNGVGIPDSEKSKIFNKFYRVGNEETRKSKGTGLGLYLTSKIVKQHKGKITVQDNEPNGSIFEMSFPMMQ
ncbi:MAG: HAMP domain-containing histidine kinase [Chitinophagaceae bacterium]|nr:HAMP domain-containing histidine kinase [Chitinophagaceae bacterium]